MVAISWYARLEHVSRPLTLCVLDSSGMEAVWKIDVENFPAFIVVDDKGNDFFEEWLG